MQGQNATSTSLRVETIIGIESIEGCQVEEIQKQMFKSYCDNNRLRA